jgi:hypothetical protein
MIEDNILKEIRAVRENYARSHDFDVYKMVADLQTMNLQGDWKIVRLPPRRPRALSAPPDGLTQSGPSVVQA